MTLIHASPLKEEKHESCQADTPATNAKTRIREDACFCLNLVAAGGFEPPTFGL